MAPQNRVRAEFHRNTNCLELRVVFSCDLCKDESQISVISYENDQHFLLLLRPLGQPIRSLRVRIFADEAKSRTRFWWSRTLRAFSCRDNCLWAFWSSGAGPPRTNRPR